MIGGDWVAHPSNTGARRILVTYPLLAAVSGDEQANGKLAAAFLSHLGFVLLSLLPRRWDFLRDMFPPSLYLSLVFTCKMRKQPESGWSISHYFSL
jgi:hypothetical protein